MLMKNHRIIIIVLVLFIIGAGVAFVVTSPSYLAREQLAQKNTSSTVVIGSTTFHVVLAKTESERAKGLMYITELLPEQGMLFVFEKEATQTFWNKNTKLALTIVWINDDKVVGTSALPSDEDGIRLVASPTSITHALELSASSELARLVKIGDSVRIHE